MFIVLGIIAAIILYVWSVYNKFVTIKTRISAATQEIGNQLKRQADLIPNLVESVKGYMKHEKEIFTEITNARKAVTGAVEAGNPQRMIEAGSQLQAALAPIRAVFESTPQLQAVGPTSKLMDELRDTADKLMYSRRTLIDLTADYNVMVVTVPSNIIAKLFSFKSLDGLKMPATDDYVSVGEDDIKTPEVKL